MKTSSENRLAICILLLLALVSTGVTLFTSPPSYLKHDLYLWAWQRNEDLSFINPDTDGIALWTGTIVLTQDGRYMDVQLRTNPVIYPEGTDLIAVIRIEAPDTLSGTDIDELLVAINALTAPYKPSGIQLDFDARVSQREFYRHLLERLRLNYPQWSLTITALASWCLGDPWIQGLDIDAAVPMLYRMGPDSDTIRRYLSDTGLFSVRLCTENTGYSTDEDFIILETDSRIFLYHPEAWTADEFEAAIKKLTDY